MSRIIYQKIVAVVWRSSGSFSTMEWIVRKPNLKSAGFLARIGRRSFFQIDVTHVFTDILFALTSYARFIRVSHKFLRKYPTNLLSSLKPFTLFQQEPSIHLHNSLSNNNNSAQACVYLISNSHSTQGWQSCMTTSPLSLNLYINKSAFRTLTK